MVSITILKELEEKFSKLAESESIEILKSESLFGGTNFKIENKETYKLYTFAKNFNNYQLNYLTSKGEIKGDSTKEYILLILTYGYGLGIPKNEYQNICTALKYIFGEKVYFKAEGNYYNITINQDNINDNYWWLY